MRKVEKGAGLEAEGVAVESILNRNLANNTPVFHISFRIPTSPFLFSVICLLYPGQDYLDIPGYDVFDIYTGRQIYVFVAQPDIVFALDQVSQIYMNPHILPAYRFNPALAAGKIQFHRPG